MDVILPDGKSIAMANQLSSTSSVVNGYLRVKLNKILQANNAVDEYQSVIDALDETTKVTRIREKCLAEISAKTWGATATQIELENIKAGTINYLDASAIEGMKLLNAKLGAGKTVSNIDMVYYIDKNSQLNRGYLINGELVADKDTELVIDQMFHSWLISHNMASDDTGVIYRRLKDGTVTDQLVPSTEITKLLEDPITGLGTTAKKIDPTLELNMIWAPPEAVAMVDEQRAEVEVQKEQQSATNQPSDNLGLQKEQMGDLRDHHHPREAGLVGRSKNN